MIVGSDSWIYDTFIYEDFFAQTWTLSNSKCSSIYIYIYIYAQWSYFGNTVWCGKLDVKAQLYLLILL